MRKKFPHHGNVFRRGFPRGGKHRRSRAGGGWLDGLMVGWLGGGNGQTGKREKVARRGGSHKGQDGEKGEGSGRGSGMRVGRGAVWEPPGRTRTGGGRGGQRGGLKPPAPRLGEGAGVEGGGKGAGDGCAQVLRKVSAKGKVHAWKGWMHEIISFDCCRGGSLCLRRGVGHLFLLRVVQFRVVPVWQGPQAHGLWGGSVHVLRVGELWVLRVFAAREARAWVWAGEVPVLRVGVLRVLRVCARGAA